MKNETKFVGVLPASPLVDYLKATQDNDARVRSVMSIPVDRYYTVSTWPDHLAGRVFVDHHRKRDKNAK